MSRFGKVDGAKRPKLLRQLTGLGDQKSPVSFAEGTDLKPKFWDSGPLVQHVNDAHRCFPSTTRTHKHAESDILKKCTFLGISPSPLFEHVCRRLFSEMINQNEYITQRDDTMQSRACDVVYSALFTNDIGAHLGSSLKRMLPAFAESIGAIDWNLVAQVCNGLSLHISMSLLKTCANAWATSHRYHENPRLECVFGCMCFCVGA